MFSQEVADRICSLMAEGRSLRSICRDEAMPGMRTVMTWLEEREGFQQQYARAFNMRADAKFDELDDVSEEAVNAESAVQVAGYRLKADNIKWQLARMNSKKYGDKIETMHSGSIAMPRELSDEELGSIAAAGSR